MMGGLKLVMEMMKLPTLTEVEGSTDKAALVFEGIEIRTKSNQPMV